MRWLASTLQTLFLYLSWPSVAERGLRSSPFHWEVEGQRPAGGPGIFMLWVSDRVDMSPLWRVAWGAEEQSGDSNWTLWSLEVSPAQRIQDRRIGTCCLQLLFWCTVCCFIALWLSSWRRVGHSHNRPPLNFTSSQPQSSLFHFLANISKEPNKINKHAFNI